MKISELSRRTGRSVATIKFYLREGLLPPGRRTAANQADYDEDHLRRLSLIATLLDVGGLSITAVRAVVAVLEDEDATLHDMLGVAHYALTASAAVNLSSEADAAAPEVDRFLDALGWRVKPEAPGRRELAGALGSLRRLGWDVDAEVFTAYASAADRIAAWELSQIPTEGPRSQAVESVVIGTVVFETVLCGLRRLAEEHHSARLTA